MKNLLNIGILTSFILLSIISCSKDNDIISVDAQANASSSAKSITSKEIYVDNPGNDNDIMPNIKKAYETANDGDILILPEGKFAFTGFVFMTRKVSIKGAGINKTLLYRPETLPDGSIDFLPMLKFAISDDNPCGIEVSGIYFKSKIPETSVAIDHAIQMYQAVDFKIHDCKFENFGEEGILVIHKDNLARGLIYDCQFYRNAKGNGLGYAYGIAIIGENQTWVESPQFGSSNFIFIEDNIFEFHKHSITSGNGGLYVARYNKIYNNTVGAGAIDMHEARNIESFSSRAGEIYNNTIINTKFVYGIDDIAPGMNPNLLVDCAILIRGGEALVYNNNTEGYRQGLNICAENYLTGPYPIKTQIGYSSSLTFGENDRETSSKHGDGDMYAWNNYHKVYECPISDRIPWFKNNSPTYLVEGRDYHFFAKPGYTPYPYPHPMRKK